ncbi:MAG: MotA/TolQ/ExbB proton channel family protein [Pirellulaceae bacterium]|nr:MotA/TolQ/ExbB proton channel family protein [Pirellulaceae bacterium]
MSMEYGYLRRKSWFVLGLALCMMLAAATAPDYLAAQDNGADAPAADAAAEKAPPNAENGDATGPKKQSTFMWLVECSGFIGFVILLLSIYFVSTVARLFWEMRIDVAAPPDVVVQCEGMLETRNFKGIYGLVKDDDSFFSRLLTAGITELPNGLAEAREAMERLGEAITTEMEKKISMLAVLGTLGPMIGLLGTLKGMIAAFIVIGQSDQQVKASEVAGALSEALVLTFEGVALAVPSIYFYALFRNRVMYISSSVILTADQFLRHFSHASRAKASAAAPAKPAN